MKKLRISFAAIIAVVAISLTVAAQAGAFEATKYVVTKCFRPSVDLEAKNPSSCSNAITDLIASTSCTTAQAFPGGGLYKVGTPFYTPAQKDDICLGGQFFCCFTVVEGSNCTGAQINPLIDLGDGGAKRYLVNEVFCRSQQDI